MKAYTPMNWVRRKTWIGIVLIVIGALGWWVGPFCDQWLTKRAEKAIAKTEAQTKTIALPRLPTERKWVLSWRKLPGTKGVNQDVRTNSFNAVVLKCDRFEFKIFGYYNNHGTTDGFIMYWNKATNPDHGSWSQKSPPLQGTWFLEPVSDSLYTGWVRNTNGWESSLWLRTID